MVVAWLKNAIGLKRGHCCEIKQAPMAKLLKQMVTIKEHFYIFTVTKIQGQLGHSHVNVNTVASVIYCKTPLHAHYFPE